MIPHVGGKRSGKTIWSGQRILKVVRDNHHDYWSHRCIPLSWVFGAADHWTHCVSHICLFIDFRDWKHPEQTKLLSAFNRVCGNFANSLLPRSGERAIWALKHLLHAVIRRHVSHEFPFTPTFSSCFNVCKFWFWIVWHCVDCMSTPSKGTNCVWNPRLRGL